MKSKACARKRFVTTTLMAGLAGLLVGGISTPVGAGPLHRQSAEFQNLTSLGASEILTTLLPIAGGAGGKLVYTKTLFVPHKTLYVTFQATGDTHENQDGQGAALLMTALTDGVACEAFDGLSTAGPSGWIALQKLPQPEAITNCNDGGGGSADCHDNNLIMSCCFEVDPGIHTVDLKLASSNGGIVFYERADITIDSSPDSNRDLCGPAALVDGSTTLP